MIEIDASWEKNNTGLKTCEVIFEKGDSFKSYLDLNLEGRYQFSVAKVPVGDLELIHHLEDIGYRYLENQISLLFEVENILINNSLEDRLVKGFGCRLVTSEKELASILFEVSNNMFETDRFSLDKFWPPLLSSKRYCNWIRELFDSGSTQFYVIFKNETDIGFFSMKSEKQGYSICPIAGIYNKHKSVGYIYSLTYFWLLKGKEMGLNRLETSVSSNNRLILSSLSKGFLFKMTEVYTVLRKIIQ